MKNAIFGSFCFLIFSINAAAQLSKPHILWQEEPLTWQDFKAAPKAESKFDANTSSGIFYTWSFSQKGKEINFKAEVKSYFLPEESWVRPHKRSAHLLQHEQIHFDITELHARKLREAMADLNVNASKNIKGEVERIYKKIEASRLKMQLDFDAQTQHSQNKRQQLKWQENIEKQLKQVEKYTS